MSVPAAWVEGYKHGRAEALREAREAVAKRCRLLHRKERTADCYHCRGVVAAIDALGGQS